MHKFPSMNEMLNKIDEKESTELEDGFWKKEIGEKSAKAVISDDIIKIQKEPEVENNMSDISKEPEPSSTFTENIKSDNALSQPNNLYLMRNKSFSVSNNTTENNSALSQFEMSSAVARTKRDREKHVQP